MESNPSNSRRKSRRALANVTAAGAGEEEEEYAEDVDTSAEVAILAMLRTGASYRQCLDLRTATAAE